MGAVYQEDHADDPGHVPLIHVGFPGLSDTVNGCARAKAQDGEVWVTVKGFGVGELSMPKAQATALRDQINNAINAI